MHTVQRSIRYLKKGFAVAGEMCLELPDPSRGKEQGLDHKREVGSQLNEGCRTRAVPLSTVSHHSSVSDSGNG